VHKLAHVSVKFIWINSGCVT